MDDENMKDRKIECRHVKVRVTTNSVNFIGTIHVPDVEMRLSDLLNDKNRGDFVNLTNVYAGERREKISFVCINKNMIELVEPFED